MFFSFIINKTGGYLNLRKKFQNTNNKLKKKYYRFLLKGFQHETNSYLPFESIIYGQVNFIHGLYGIFISGSAKIGKNCTIYHQVTIGSNMLIDSKNLGSPVIGDNCFIGAGAKIVGNIIIGNNCRIGANTVVTSDLPDNSVIFAGNQVVVQKETIENKVYQYTSEGWGYRQDGIFVKEESEENIIKLEKTLPEFKSKKKT